MSRSRKKTPTCPFLCGGRSYRARRRYFKRLFNKRIRRAGLGDVPDGRAFRKHSKSWEICEGLLHCWCPPGADGGEREYASYMKYYVRK